MRFATGLMVVATLALVGAACGDSGDDGSGGLAELAATQIPVVAPTAVPTPTSPPPPAALSEYTPTLEDYVSVIITPASNAIQSTEQVFQQYAAVYIAEECIGGRERSAEGFRSFVEQTLIFPPGRDRMELMAVIADSAIGSIVRLADEQAANGRSTVEDGCLALFTYPETLGDTLIAANLVATVAVINVNQVLVGQMPSIIATMASDWFATEGSKVPLLSRLCDAGFSVLGRSLCRADG